MSGRIALIATALAVAGTPAAVQPAKAQCRLCSTPITGREAAAQGDAMRLEIDTRLDFDRLVLVGDGDGTATLRPDGSRSSSGVVAGFGGRAMVGTVAVHGTPERLLRIDLPDRIELYSLSGGRITIDQLTSDLPSTPRLDSSGRLTFRLGGRLRVSGDSEGDYSGDVPITVDYL